MSVNMFRRVPDWVPTVESLLLALCSNSPVLASTMHSDSKCFNIVLRNSRLSTPEEQQNDKKTVGEKFSVMRGVFCLA